LGRPHPGDGQALARYCERYDYDECGNLTRIQHLDSCPGAVSWTRTFEYAEPSRLPDPSDPQAVGNRLTSTTVGAQVETFSVAGDGYDAAGNLLRMAHLQELAWNHRDQLTMTRRQAVGPGDTDGVARQGERTFNVYDAGGRRVRQVTTN